MLHLGLEQIPLCSLAKENEEIFVPHTPESIVLARDSQALYLMQRIRDEAHRFAISFHRNLRSKSSLKSPIDMVTGIGPKRKRMLLRRFGSLQGIKEASVEDIAAVPGPDQIARGTTETDHLIGPTHPGFIHRNPVTADQIALQFNGPSKSVSPQICHCERRVAILSAKGKGTSNRSCPVPN